MDSNSSLLNLLETGTTSFLDELTRPDDQLPSAVMTHQSVGPQQGTGAIAGHSMSHANGSAMMSHDQGASRHHQAQYWGQQVYMGNEYAQYGGMGGTGMHASQDGSQMSMMQGGGHQMSSQFPSGGGSAYGGGYSGMAPAVRGPQVVTPPRQPGQGQVMTMRSPMWTQQSPGGMAEHGAGSAYVGGTSGAGLRHMYGGGGATGGYMSSPQHSYSSMNPHQHMAGYTDQVAAAQKHYGMHAGSSHMRPMKVGGPGQMGSAQGVGSSQLVPSQRAPQRSPHMSMMGPDGSQMLANGARMPSMTGQYSFNAAVQGQQQPSCFNSESQHLQGGGAGGGLSKQLHCQTPLQGHMQLQGQQLQGQAQHAQGQQQQPLVGQQLVPAGQQVLPGQQAQQLQSQGQHMQAQAQQMQGQTQQLQHLQAQTHQMQSAQGPHQLHSEYAGQSQQQQYMMQMNNGQYSGKQGPYGHQQQQRAVYPGTPLGQAQMMSPGGSKSIHSQGVPGAPASMLSPGAGSGQAMNTGGSQVLGAGSGHAVPPVQYRPMSQQQRQQMFAMNQMRQSGLMNNSTVYVGGSVGAVMSQQSNLAASPYSYPGQSGGLISQSNETMPQQQSYNSMQPPGGKPSTMMDMQERFGPQQQQMSYSQQAQQHELQLHGAQQQFMGSSPQQQQQSSVVIVQQGGGATMQPSQMNQVRNSALQMAAAETTTKMSVSPGATIFIINNNNSGGSSGNGGGCRTTLGVSGFTGAGSTLGAGLGLDGPINVALHSPQGQYPQLEAPAPSQAPVKPEPPVVSYLSSPQKLPYTWGRDDNLTTPPLQNAGEHSGFYSSQETRVPPLSLAEEGNDTLKPQLTPTEAPEGEAVVKKKRKRKEPALGEDGLPIKRPRKKKKVPTATLR